MCLSLRSPKKNSIGYYNIENNMEITNSKETYKAPGVREVKVKVQGVLCNSLDGSFGLSNDGHVERGNDSDWGEDLDW